MEHKIDAPEAGPPELYFLVARFIEAAGLHHSARVFGAELQERGLLGREIDWTGTSTHADLRSFEQRFPNVPGHQLAVLFQGAQAVSFLRPPLLPTHRPQFTPAEESLRAKLGAASRRAGYEQQRELLRFFRETTVKLASARACLRVHRHDLLLLKSAQPPHGLLEIDTGAPDLSDAAATAAIRQRAELIRRQVEAARFASESEGRVAGLAEQLPLAQDVTDALSSLRLAGGSSARNPRRSVAALLASSEVRDTRRRPGASLRQWPTSGLPHRGLESLLKSRYEPGKVLNGHGFNEVYCVVFDQTGRFLATGADDMLVKVWNVDSALLMYSLRGHMGEITDLAVSPNNALLASSDTKQMIRVWALEDGSPVAVLSGHGEPLARCAGHTCAVQPPAVFACVSMHR